MYDIDDVGPTTGIDILIREEAQEHIHCVASHHWMLVCVYVEHLK